MKFRILATFVLLITLVNTAYNQSQFKATVSSDTVLLGNYLILSFTAENIEGNFEAPDLEGFEILSGPFTSSSFQSINGKTSQSISYSFHIKPKDIGYYDIPPAYFISEDNQYESKPLSIYCAPNPDGIIIKAPQEELWTMPDFNFDFSIPEGWDLLEDLSTPNMEEENYEEQEKEFKKKKSSKRKLKKI